jgi:hypothetical protein
MTTRALDIVAAVLAGAVLVATLAMAVTP